MALTPENITEQFINLLYGRNVSEANPPALGHTVWLTEMATLFGDDLLVYVTGDKRFEGVSDIQDRLQEACRARGVTGMKAEFLTHLIHDTRASSLYGGGLVNILEQIIDFQPQEKPE